MKSTYKAATLTLISLVTTVVAINSSAFAGDRVGPAIPVTLKVSTPLGCTLEHNKEFTQAVVVKNITNQTIESGKVISFVVYYYGKAQTKQQYTLSQPLAPGQETSLGDQVSSETSANYTCKASY